MVLIQKQLFTIVIFLLNCFQDQRKGHEKNDEMTNASTATATTSSTTTTSSITTTPSTTTARARKNLIHSSNKTSSVKKVKLIFFYKI